MRSAAVRAVDAHVIVASDSLTAAALSHLIVSSPRA